MRRLLFILFILTNLLTKAQDIHFTQWMHAPHTYSPADVGDFIGKYRFIANYKNQWSSVTVPFTTYSIFADSRQWTKNDKIGLSGGIIHDVTGDSRFSTTVFNLGGGYRFQLPDSLGILSFAIQPAITQKKIDMTNLNFDEQFNGYFFDGNIPVTENLARQARWYFDMALGVKHNYQHSKSIALNTSFSVYNIFKSKQSFFDNHEIRLDRRWIVNSELRYSYSDRITLYPGIMMSFQGKFNSINFGALADYDLSESQYSKQSIFGGVYFRAVDSGDIIVGMNYNEWRAAISYDINYSNLTPASNYKGGLELAVIYIIPQPYKRPVYKVCPDYL